MIFYSIFSAFDNEQFKAFNDLREKLRLKFKGRINKKYLYGVKFVSLKSPRF